MSSEFTDVLQQTRREFPAPEMPLERVLRRRDVRRRNYRIASAALALLLAAAAIGGAIHLFRVAQRQLPAHPGIYPGNVKDLQLAWAARLEGTPSNVDFGTFKVLQLFPPTVAGGMVYVATTAGKLYAFGAACGAEGTTCQPSWVADTGGRIANPPAVADGLVFVSSEGGILAAYPANCGTGGATCEPTWIAHTQRPFDTPVVADGVVYGVDAINGVVYAFDERCGTGDETCGPLWTAITEPSNEKSVGGFHWQPTVANGVVYAVGSSDHPDRLYAFDAGTGTRLWWAAAATPPRGGGGQAATTPIVSDDLVLVSFQTLYAFPVGCRTDGGRCQPIWTIAHGGQTRIVEDGTLFVKWFHGFIPGGVSAYDLHCATGGAACKPIWTAQSGGWGEFVSGDGTLVSTSNKGPGRIDAFPVTCGTAGNCEPLWTAQVKGARTPLIAGGLVYVPTASGALYAFPLACGTGGKTCDPVWTAPGIDVQTSPPTIAGDRLFLASADGRLFAFALPNAGESGAAARSSSAPTFVFYLGLAGAAAFHLLLGTSCRRRHLEEQVEPACSVPREEADDADDPNPLRRVVLRGGPRDRLHVGGQPGRR